MKPTIEFYSYLTDTFDFFNKKLFDNQLSQVVFVVTRKKRVAGHFRSAGWVSEDDNKFHEIAVNPAYFVTASPLELYQTIVHEMAHQWQNEFGKESRGGYHNTQWANKMREIGLEPISANGKGTGQAVGDKPIPNGPFERACIELFLTGLKLTVVDGFYISAEQLRKLNEVLSSRISAATNQTSKNTDNKKAADKQPENDFDDHSQDVEDNEQSESDFDDHSQNIEDDGYSQDEEDENLAIIQLMQQFTQNQELDDDEHALLIETISAPISDIFDIKVNSQLKPQANNNHKSRYICGNCGIKAWGGKNIELTCTPCQEPMENR